MLIIKLFKRRKPMTQQPPQTTLGSGVKEVKDKKKGFKAFLKRLVLGPFSSCIQPQVEDCCQEAGEMVAVVRAEPLPTPKPEHARPDTPAPPSQPPSHSGAEAEMAESIELQKPCSPSCQTAHRAVSFSDASSQPGDDYTAATSDDDFYSLPDTEEWLEDHATEDESTSGTPTATEAANTCNPPLLSSAAPSSAPAPTPAAAATPALHTAYDDDSHNKEEDYEFEFDWDFDVDVSKVPPGMRARMAAGAF